MRLGAAVGLFGPRAFGVCGRQRLLQRLQCLPDLPELLLQITEVLHEPLTADAANYSDDRMHALGLCQARTRSHLISLKAILRASQPALPLDELRKSLLCQVDLLLGGIYLACRLRELRLEARQPRLLLLLQWTELSLHPRDVVAEAPALVAPVL